MSTELSQEPLQELPLEPPQEPLQEQYCDVSDFTGYDSDDEPDMKYGELNELQLASKLGQFDVVKTLCEEKRFDVDENNYRRYCALSLAALFKHDAIVKFLVVEGGAKIDNYTTDAFHQSALYYSVLYGNQELCQFLIEHGAQVNQCWSANFEHPLHIAIRNNHTHLLPTLLAAKANPNAELSTGRKDSVLSYAILNGCFDAIPLLQEFGAIPSQNVEQGLYGFIEISPNPANSFKAAFQLTQPGKPDTPFYNGVSVGFGLYGCLRSRKRTTEYIKLLLDFDQQHNLDGVNSPLDLTGSWISLIVGFNQDKVEAVMAGEDKKTFTAYELAVIKNDSEYLELIKPFASAQGIANGQVYSEKLGY